MSSSRLGFIGRQSILNNGIEFYRNSLWGRYIFLHILGAFSKVHSSYHHEKDSQQKPLFCVYYSHPLVIRSFWWPVPSWGGLGAPQIIALAQTQVCDLKRLVSELSWIVGHVKNWRTVWHQRKYIRDIKEDFVMNNRSHSYHSQISKGFWSSVPGMGGKVWIYSYYTIYPKVIFFSAFQAFIWATYTGWVF